jgi:ribonuclease Z
MLYVRIAHRGNAFLFDCGDLHSLTPREAIKIQALFISHAHIDHMVGFGALLRFFLYRDNPLCIYGPSGITERITGQLSGYTWNLIRDYPIRISVYELCDGIIRSTDFSGRKVFKPENEHEYPCTDNVLLKFPYGHISALPLTHGDITSLAFSLEEPRHIGIHKDALEKHGYLPGPWLTHFKDLIRADIDLRTTLRVPCADGREEDLALCLLFDRIAHTERGMKISYVTDVSPTPENIEKIIPFVRNSHFLAIEAVFSHQDLEKARERNHLTAHLAGTIARRGGCTRFLTFHHSPRYEKHPGLLAEEARQAFLGAKEPTGPNNS